MRSRNDRARVRKPINRALVAWAVVAALPALWTAGYFFINSSVGAALLDDAVTSSAPPGALRVGRISVAPSFGTVYAFDVVALNAEDREAIRVGLAVVDVALPSLKPRAVEVFDARVLDDAGHAAISARRLGCRIDIGEQPASVRLHDVVAEDFALHFGWDAAARFNLDRTFAFKRKKPTVPKPPEPKVRKPPPEVSLEGIKLVNGLVTLDWPTFGMTFENVTAKGGFAVSKDRGLVIVAGLRGGRSNFAWTAGRSRTLQRFAFESLVIQDYRWAADGFSVVLAELTTRAGARVAVGGDLGQSEPEALRISGDVDLTGDETARLTASVLPAGSTLRGIQLTFKEDSVEGGIQELEVPLVESADARLEGIAASIRGNVRGPVRLPTGTAEVTAARVRRLRVPGLSADGVGLERIALGLAGGGLDAEFVDLSVDGFEVEKQGRVGKSNARGTLNVGLMRDGNLEAVLRTDQGKVEATGKLDVSVFSMTAKLDTVLRFHGLRGALVTLAFSLSRMPQALRASLTPPLSGHATVLGKLARDRDDEGRRRLLPVFDLRDAEFVGAGRVVYEAEEWAVVPTDAGAPP